MHKTSSSDFKIFLFSTLAFQWLCVSEYVGFKVYCSIGHIGTGSNQFKFIFTFSFQKIMWKKCQNYEFLVLIFNFFAPAAPNWNSRRIFSFWNFLLHNRIHNIGIQFLCISFLVNFWYFSPPLRFSVYATDSLFKNTKNFPSFVSFVP